MDIGGQMGWSSEVDNYPGIPDSTGIALVQKFNQHLKDYNIKINLEEILNLWKKGNTCIIKTKKHIYESKAVIVACGKAPKKLKVPGEEELIGKGVSYCASCDTPLYKNKTTVVVGGGNSGMEAALFLAKYAKKIYLLDLIKKMNGEPYLIDKVMREKKISFIGEANIKKILGDNFVKGLIYEQLGKQKTLVVNGVFIEIGLINKANFTDVKKNTWGAIMLFRSTITHEENMTNISGIFAAGDCTDIPAKQIIAAAGEGCKAALAAFNYIDKWK